MENPNPPDKIIELEKHSQFDGDPKNAKDILRYLEKEGYTHVHFQTDGILNFQSEDEASVASHIAEHPQEYLSFASSEVVEVVQNYIEKGYIFAPTSMALLKETNS